MPSYAHRRLECAITIYARPTQSITSPHECILGQWFILPDTFALAHTSYVSYSRFAYSQLNNNPKRTAPVTSIDEAITTLTQMAMDDPYSLFSTWGTSTMEYRMHIRHVIIRLPLCVSIYKDTPIDTEWSTHPSTAFIGDEIRRIMHESTPPHGESWDLYARNMHIDSRHLGSAQAVQYTRHPTDMNGRYTIERFWWINDAGEEVVNPFKIVVLPINTPNTCRIGLLMIDHTSPITHAILLPYDNPGSIEKDLYLSDQIPCTKTALMDALHAWTIPECSQHTRMEWQRMLAHTTPDTNPLVQDILHARDALQQDLQAWVASTPT